MNKQVNKSLDVFIYTSIYTQFPQNVDDKNCRYLYVVNLIFFLLFHFAKWYLYINICRRKLARKPLFNKHWVESVKCEENSTPNCVFSTYQIY